MAWRLIGTVTIVGMVFSSGIAIFLVPPLLVMVERLSHRIWGERMAEQPLRKSRGKSFPSPHPTLPSNV